MKAAGSLICYTIRLRDAGEDANMMADVLRDFLAFNTMKFSTLGGAVAYCRKREIDPRDAVIVRAEFPQPVVLETFEIGPLLESGAPTEQETPR